MLFLTGFSRFSSDIQQTTEKALVDKQAQPLRCCLLSMTREKVLTSKTDLKFEFGRLLDYTWKQTRNSNRSPRIPSTDSTRKVRLGERSAESFLEPAAADSSLFYVEPDKQEQVHKAMEELLYVPFEFENSGTRVIHYTPENV